MSAWFHFSFLSLSKQFVIYGKIIHSICHIYVPKIFVLSIYLIHTIRYTRTKNLRFIYLFNSSYSPHLRTKNLRFYLLIKFLSFFFFLLVAATLGFQQFGDSETGIARIGLRQFATLLRLHQSHYRGSKQLAN